jgi:hypothetical protein
MTKNRKMRINTLIIVITLSIVSSCKTINDNKTVKKTENTNSETSKIKVLNFATFHFGDTPDANKVDFDEKNSEIQKEVRKISEMIAKFKPTIICVETLPKNDDKLLEIYQDFLKNPSQLKTENGEMGMIALDVARLSNTNKIYGIDNKMGYNYGVGDFIERSPDLTNSIDPKTYLEMTNNPFKDYPEIKKRDKNFENSSLIEKLKLINEPIYLDHLINTNADKLLYVGVEDGFEGADNAAIFYHRNMKIYSNLNRIKMNKNDRVFILMGGAHTAFLREFIKRSPKFEMVNTLEYLN